MQVGTSQQFSWLKGIVAAVLILNLIDAVLTLIWLSAGMAVEANPLLQLLAHQHPVLFGAVKTSLVSLGSWVLWHYRRRPLAVISTFIAFLAYYLLILYHLESLELGLVRRLLG